jgi:hypothetical protein
VFKRKTPPKNYLLVFVSFVHCWHRLNIVCLSEIKLCHFQNTEIMQNIASYDAKYITCGWFLYFESYISWKNLIADKQNILALCQQWTNETNTKRSFLGGVFLYVSKTARQFCYWQLLVSAPWKATSSQTDRSSTWLNALPSTRCSISFHLQNEIQNPLSRCNKGKSMTVMAFAIAVLYIATLICMYPLPLFWLG